ncbi:ATP-binding protein [Actinoplanes couchii]|uniref:AAA+ ATPase domain-containing protein n=1 Tax=Actinoplanes couchii TaxID=403638 RepID=A0ABQ3WZL8_9ACTN|nr:tetratricopeptide repeat protein [Actinoplanes couchii]MDR6316048.1 tetratricopeptide (TPR) repeat protein [Actinoplanes couchii]GID51662.1 hypothetical protein Aco03nite_000660 [Actinoplanes couchii]
MADVQAEEPDHGPEHVNRSRLSGPADLVQARDVYGGVHFHQDQQSGDPRPRQLPGAVHGFVNRASELRRLSQPLGEESGVLWVLTGTAGVGKTSLALRWAHSVRQDFPHGQLYANLRGYDPGQPADPGSVLDRFLRALGTPGTAIPADLDDRAALYRSLLADRRVLIVLDNASTARQIRPLLPGTSSCLVVVTSRSLLSGLITRDGGRRLTVRILDQADAVNLLQTVTADYRAGDDPDEFTELARLCACLPLALRIAAERAASRPFMTLAELAQDLRDESALWEALTAEDGEEADAVRTVFAWSYRALSEPVARMFRLLGLHPGAEFSTPAAAALAGVSTNQVRHLLDGLVNSHLVEQVGTGRYRLHDLLRAYAIEEQRKFANTEDQTDGVRRILAWYLHSADAAVAVTLQFNRTMPLDPPHDVIPMTFTSNSEATAWLDAERDNLVAATKAAAEHGRPHTAWQLAAVLRSVFMHNNAFEEWLSTAPLGLDAARAIGDRQGEAEALESLGKAHFQARRLTEAARFHEAALAIRTDIGDDHGTAVSINALGLLGLRHRRLDEARAHFERSLAIFERLGNRRWQALLLSNIAEAAYETGDLTNAISLLTDAIDVQRDIGDEGQEGNSLFFLSMSLRELERIDEARLAIERALGIADKHANQVWTAHWLVECARVERASGEPATALEAAHRAATIQRTIGDQSREAMALDEAGEAYRALGQPKEASAFHRRATAAHRRMQDKWQLAISLHHLALDLTDESRHEEAHRHWHEAHSLLATFPDARSVRMREQIFGLMERR